MEPHLRRAVAKIEVRHNGAVSSRGTGTLVAPGLVLTALHVVGERKSEPTSFYPGEIHLTFPDHTTVAVPVEDKHDRHLDWALLRCETPPDIPPAPLGDLKHGGQEWMTYGFPDAQPIDGMVQAGTVRNIEAKLGGQPSYQLFSEDAAAGNGAPVKGLSGGPVFVDGALVGVLRFALMKEGQAVAGTLYACPAHLPVDSCAGMLPIPDPCAGLPGLPRKPLPEQPFRYLARYDADDSEIFFGRNRQIRALYDLITDPGTADVILLYGQTGVGKSSFLDAGLVPRLSWRYRVRYLRRELGSSLLATVRRTLREEAKGRYPGADAPLRDLWLAAEAECGRPLGIFLDQVEEVYTRAGTVGDDEVTELGGSLAHAFGDDAGPRGRLVLSFRKEWYPEIQKRLEEQRVDFARVFLEALDAEGIREAVKGLTSTQRLRERYGLTVSEELPNVIAAHLLEDPDSPVAPTLQILLTKMWEVATATNRSAPAFHSDLFQTLRQEGVLLGDFLHQRIEALHERHADAVESGLVLDVLAQHTTPLLTADECSVRALVADYGHHPGFAQLLADMQDLYILVDGGCDRGTGDSITRLTHDTLAPHVRKLYDESILPGQAAKRIIHSRVNEDDDSSDMAPLGPRTLEAVEAGLAGMRALEPEEQRLVAMSRTERDRQVRAKRRAKVSFITLMIFFALSSVVAASFAKKATRDQRETELSNTTDRVRSDLQAFPALGLVAAFNAVCDSINDDFPLANELQMSLSDSVESAREANWIAMKSAVNAVAVKPGTQTFAVALVDGSVRLFDLCGNETLPHLECYEGSPLLPDRTDVSWELSARGIAYSNDGTRIYAVSGDGHLRIFRPFAPGSAAVVGKRLTENARGPSPLRCVAVSEDGERVATGSDDGELVIWSADGTELRQLRPADPTPTRVNAIAFLPGGRQLVSAHDDGWLRTWDVDAESPVLKKRNEGQGPVLSVAVAAAKAAEDHPIHIAAGGQDQSLRVYQVDLEPLTRFNDVRFSHAAADGRPLDEMPHDEGNRRSVVIDTHRAPVTAVAFGPEGQFVMSGDADGIVYVHDHRGNQMSRAFRGLDDAVTTIAYVDQNRAVIGSRDATVRIRDNNGLQEKHDLRVRGRQRRFNDPAIEGVAINPEGTRLATTADADHSIIWNRADFARLQEIERAACTAHLFDVDFVPVATRNKLGVREVLPQNELLVAGCAAGHVHVWTRAQKITTHDFSEGQVACIDVDSTSRFVAAGSSDGAVIVVDLKEGTFEFVRPADPGTLHGEHLKVRGPPLVGVTDVALGPGGDVVAVAYVEPGQVDAGAIEIWERSTPAGGDPVWAPRTLGRAKTDGHQYFSYEDNRGVTYGLAMRSIPGSTDESDLTLFSIGRDGKIRGRDLDGRRRFSSMKAHLGGAIAIDVSDDGKRVITGGFDGRVVLWGVMDGDGDDGLPEGADDAPQGLRFARIAELTPSHLRPVYTVSFGGVGDWTAMSGSEDGSARVWIAHSDLWLEIAADRLAGNNWIRDDLHHRREKLTARKHWNERPWRHDQHGAELVLPR